MKLYQFNKHNESKKKNYFVGVFISTPLYEWLQY